MSVEGLEGQKTSIVGRIEAAYDYLLPHASFVAGMPFETPLRWQEVHGSVTDVAHRIIGLGSVVARYVMIDYGDNRHLTLYKEIAPQDYVGMKWRVTASEPHAAGDGKKTETILKVSSRYGISMEVYDQTVSGGCLSYRKGNAIDLHKVGVMVAEAEDTAPERQKEFLQKLSN